MCALTVVQLAIVYGVQNYPIEPLLKILKHLSEN